MIETCQSCGITHQSVECIGIYHCPNALCFGCGGGWFRRTLDSYREIASTRGELSVDNDEWLLKGREANLRSKIDRMDFYRVEHKEPPPEPYSIAWIEQYYEQQAKDYEPSAKCLRDVGVDDFNYCRAFHVICKEIRKLKGE